MYFLVEKNIFILMLQNIYKLHSYNHIEVSFKIGHNYIF